MGLQRFNQRFKVPQITILALNKFFNLPLYESRPAGNILKQEGGCGSCIDIGCGNFLLLNAIF